MLCDHAKVMRSLGLPEESRYNYNYWYDIFAGYIDDSEGPDEDDECRRKMQRGETQEGYEAVTHLGLFYSAMRGFVAGSPKEPSDEESYIIGWFLAAWESQNALRAKPVYKYQAEAMTHATHYLLEGLVADRMPSLAPALIHDQATREFRADMTLFRHIAEQLPALTPGVPMPVNRKLKKALTAADRVVRAMHWLGRVPKRKKEPRPGITLHQQLTKVKTWLEARADKEAEKETENKRLIEEVDESLAEIPEEISFQY